MRWDWLKSFRSSWKSLRQTRSRRARREPHLPVTIEQLEPLVLLTDVYIYSGGGMGANQDILEGGSIYINLMSAGMSTGPATLHYRIENLDRGLDGTTYENSFDGTLSFSGPMQGAQLVIPTIDNTLDELTRHFRVSFAPGAGMGPVNVSAINVTVHDNDFDSANAYRVVNVTTYERDYDSILDLGNPGQGNGLGCYWWGVNQTTEPEDWSNGSTWSSGSMYGQTSVALTITGDVIAEYSETLSVFAYAYEPPNPYQTSGTYYFDLYAPWTAEYRITIVDNDPDAKVFLDPNNPETVNAGNIWSGNVVIDGPTEKTVFVDVSTSNGTTNKPATAGTDYSAVATTLSITGTTSAPGYRVSMPVSVQTLSPSGTYPKDFHVNLNNPVDLQLSTAAAKSFVIYAASIRRPLCWKPNKD